MTRTTTTALALAATLGLTGCARHAPHARTAPQVTKASPTRFAEVDVSGLPRGSFPTRPPSAPRSSAVFTHAAPGIYVDAAKDTPRVSGLKNDSDVFEIAIKDEPESAAAYCFAYDSLTGPPPEGTIGLVTQVGLPMVDDEFAVRAERIVEEGGRPRFELVRGWVSEKRGFARLAQGSAPLERIASFESVEVFAFVDDSLARTSSSVDFVIRRPPIRRSTVRYAAFIARLPDGHGVAAGCRHLRVTLPLTLGDAASATVDVGVETAEGARRIRIQLGTLWLPETTPAKVTARLDWHGAEEDPLSLPDPEKIDDVTSKRRRSR